MEHCLDSVEALLRQLATQLADGADGALELEARLGYINPADCSFRPGVPPAVFDRLLRAFELNDSWAATTDFAESRDVAHRCRTGDRLVRTTTGPDGVTHCVKTVLGRAALCATGQRVTAAGSALDVRVSLAREELVLSRDLPAHACPEWVRVKQRRSFTWGAWRWDFTRVWQAATFLEADAAVATQPPLLEVELELARPGAYLGDACLGQPPRTPRHAAESLLLKLHDMLAPLADDPTLAYYPPEHFTQ